jgi:hypothetical protein
LLVRVFILHILMLAICLVVSNVWRVLFRSLGACSASWRLEPIAKVKQLPAIAHTRKYDLACSTASEVLSSAIMRRPRTPVASSDCTRSRERDVVLLKHIAGVTQAGNLNGLVAVRPNVRDKSV